MDSRAIITYEGEGGRRCRFLRSLTGAEVERAAPLGYFPRGFRAHWIGPGGTADREALAELPLLSRAVWGLPLELVDDEFVVDEATGMVVTVSRHGSYVAGEYVGEVSFPHAEDWIAAAQFAAALAGVEA